MYLGFIALVPRRFAAMWFEAVFPPVVGEVLSIIVRDSVWREDQCVLPDFGRGLVLEDGGVTYTVLQYTSHNGDRVGVACSYAHEGLGPAPGFATDRDQHQAVGVTIIEIQPAEDGAQPDIGEQIRAALRNETGR